MLFAMAAVSVACSKESSSIEQEEATATSVNEVVLFAEIPSMEDETKATADGSFTWAAGDKIAIPVSGGYVDFVYNEAKGAFTYTVTDEVFVDGTAYYPASSKPAGDYSVAFSSPDEARAAFKMEADYHVGDASITFTHKSALIDLNFSNVPSFATSVRVKEGESVVATVALSSPSSDVEVKVPVTPNGNKKYSFAIMENSNVIKEVSKTTSLTAGKYYTTPGIAVKYVQVGVVYYIYEDWGLTTGWKLYYGGGASGDTTVDLLSLGTSKNQSVGSSFWSGNAQKFYLFYTPVPSDITKFKVHWTNGTDTDWYGSDATSDKKEAYVFEYDSYKNAIYY